MRGLLLSSLLAALALALTALSGAAVAARWTDPAGDAGTAPDITAVAVSNDAAGTITFAIDLVAHQALASDEGIGVYIDSDQSASTGQDYHGYGRQGRAYMRGIDRLVFLYSGGVWEFDAWNGHQLAQVTNHGPMSVTYTPTRMTVTITKADLGGPAERCLAVSAFQFWVWTQKARHDPRGLAAADHAPELGHPGYVYTLTTVSKVVTAFKPGSARKGVHPGSRFAITAAVGLSDGTTAQADSLTCEATVAGKSLPAAGTCAWKVPKSAAGKTIVIGVTVAYGGRSYPARVTVRVLRK